MQCIGSIPQYFPGYMWEKDYIYLVKSIPCSILKLIFFRWPGKTMYEKDKF